MAMVEMQTTAALAESRRKMQARRRLKNRIALTLSIATMAFGLFWLIWILMSTITRGIDGMSLALFTEMTPPPHTEGGGLANALAGSGLLILWATVFGTPLGIIAATHRNGIADRIFMFIAMLGVSVPAFWLALMMVVVFSVKLGWLPAFGVGGFKYYIMPCLANCLAGVATQARQTRSSMLEVIRSDYVTTAKAKGLSEREVLLKHALPNALIPIITIVGNGMGMMLGGTVVIENVFSIPGIGSYMTSAINSRDYPIVMGVVLLLGLIFSLIMLLVDVVYAFVDPRIKAQYEGKKGRKSHA